MEVYHFNFCGKQLGFRQAIPVPFFDFIHCGTSYCLCFPSEVIFPSSRWILEVMSKITHKPVVLNFKCNFLFITWWEAKWCKKYDGDLREAHDRLFGQVFFKSLLKNEELDSWKEAINQKNQLLLIGKPHCFNFPLSHYIFTILFFVNSFFNFVA